MNADYKDTPMLRDEYRDLQRVGIQMMGCSASDFNKAVFDEMDALKMDFKPRNFVLAATEVLRFIAMLDNEEAFKRRIEVE